MSQEKMVFCSTSRKLCPVIDAIVADLDLFLPNRNSVRGPCMLTLGCNLDF